MSGTHQAALAPAAASGRNIAATAAVAVLMASAVWRAIGGPPSLALAMALAALVLIGSEYQNIPARLRRTAMALFGASILLLPFARSPLEALQRGIFVFGLLMALMGSIMLLARCALRSEQIGFIGAILRAMRPGRRYLSFTLTSQAFSGMLGLAGTNIVLVMASPEAEREDPHKIVSTVATMRGFSAAIFWSPMLGNMAILLALYPGLRWLDVLPVGLAAAALTVLVGVAMNRRAHGSTHDAPVTPAPAGKLGGALLPLLGMVGMFVALIIATSHMLGSAITPAVVLLGPLLALLLNLLMSPGGKRMAEGGRRMREDVAQFPKLASEALLFAAAGCAGSIMAAAFPLSWAEQISQLLSGLPFFAIVFLMGSIMLASLAGIHPVLSSVFLSSTLTPEILGLPALPHFFAILIGWGLTASLTPFSAMCMMASRYTGANVYEISIGRNWLFALVNAILASSALTVLALVIRG